MLHIATVHWNNEDWIDIQLSYLKRHITIPFRVYAFLNGVSEENRPKFHYSSSEPIREHAVKLNLLAGVICSQSEDDSDVIVFLDGDAFPIADFMPLIEGKLAAHRLIAVQRLENNGDRQPHPCFCVTTVGFWKSVGGDWNEGHFWPDSSGRLVTDVGGNLMRTLEERKVDWYPLLRSNRTNLHPLWFGIYGGVVYHHGAGFRPDKVSRADLAELARSAAAGSAISRGARRLLDYACRKSGIAALRKRTRFERASERNRRIGDEFLEQIRRDPCFYRRLLE